VIPGTREVDVMRCFLGVGLLAAVTFGTTHALHADDKKRWQDAELEKFQGRWSAIREETIIKGHVQRDVIERRWVDLEFEDGNLKVTILDEKRKETWHGSIEVIGIERSDSGTRLLLGRDGRTLAAIHYDFVGEKMILVGGIAKRPFEGFRLSGEYGRARE